LTTFGPLSALARGSDRHKNVSVAQRELMSSNKEPLKDSLSCSVGRRPVFSFVLGTEGQFEKNKERKY
jgi:hypothetical protein